MKVQESQYLAWNKQESKGACQLDSFVRIAFLKLGLISSIAMFLFACEEQPLPALTGSQREMIDTFYLQRVEVLRPKLDSICNANFDANVKRAVDSLIKVRKEEEARLRERILRQQ